MPAHLRQRPPAGHGEVLCVPPYDEWRTLARENAVQAETWPDALRELRELARAETLAVATRFSASIGVHAPRRGDGLVVMTGHQPELFHPGVWVKHFLAARLAADTGAVAIDVVVDSDVAEPVSLRVPCLRPTASVCSVELVTALGDRAYVQLPPPGPDAVRRFRALGTEALATLPAPALGRHFNVFCDALEEWSPRARDAAVAVTAARRAYERPCGAAYLELPVSDQARTESFRRFAAMLLLDARRFAATANAELAAYRDRTGARSAAQPFPDLEVGAERVEAPFWVLDDRGRQPLFVRGDGALQAAGRVVGRLAADAHATAASLGDSGAAIVPRALTLTMFERLFACDLFIHGTGGARYDEVTDAVMRSYFAVEPPRFATASMTLFLPIGGRIVTDEDVVAAERRLKRLEHNPDELLDEIEFDTVLERREAERLAAEKARLVSAISQPGADRKALGREIRAVNEALVRLLRPLVEQVAAEVERVRAARDASEVLTDRTYPFCLWDPCEVFDKVR